MGLFTIVHITPKDLIKLSVLRKIVVKSGSGGDRLTVVEFIIYENVKQMNKGDGRHNGIAVSLRCLRDELCFADSPNP